MSKSLYHQFYTAIENGYSPGESKRSYKMQNGELDNKIYMMSYKHEIQVTAKQIAEYIREACPGVSRVRDIPGDAWQGYIDKKAKEGISSLTVDKLRSHISKLQACIDAKFGGNSRKHGTYNPIDTSDKQRCKPMPVTLSEALKGVVSKPVANCITLGQVLGLRQREAVQVRKEAFHLEPGAGRFGYGFVCLTGDDGTKHGKPRTVDVRSEADRRKLLDVLEGSSGVTAISKKDGTAYDTGSIQRAMTRGLSKLGVSGYEQNRLHAIRKTAAQEMYDFMRTSTKDKMTVAESKRAALEFVNKQIGHERADDKKLNNAYIANQW